MSKLIFHMAGLGLLLLLAGCNGAAASSDATATSPPVAQRPIRARRLPLSPSPSPSPSEAPPSIATSVFLKKNLAFDAMRNRAIESMYAGNTLQALAIVKAARKLRPQDSSIAYWLHAAESGVVPDRRPIHGRLIAPLMPKPSLKPKPLPSLIAPSFTPLVLPSAPAARAAPPALHATPLPRRTIPAFNPNLLD